MALALKCLLELCIVFSAPSIFLLSASHAAVEMQGLLFPAAGKQAGVPGALRLAACAGCAVLCCAVPALSLLCHSSRVGIRVTPFTSSQVISQWKIHPAQLLCFLESVFYTLGFASAGKRCRKLWTKSLSVSEAMGLNVHVSEKKKISLHSVAE